MHSPARHPTNKSGWCRFVRFAEDHPELLAVAFAAVLLPFVVAASLSIFTNAPSRPPAPPAIERPAAAIAPAAPAAFPRIEPETLPLNPELVASLPAFEVQPAHAATPEALPALEPKPNADGTRAEPSKRERAAAPLGPPRPRPLATPVRLAQRAPHALVGNPCAFVVDRPLPRTNEAVRELVAECFGDNLAQLRRMVAIGHAESRFSHYDAHGNIVRNQNTPDCGMFQINDMHLPDARRLGIANFCDDPRHNIAMARFLVERRRMQGHDPYADWNASKHNQFAARIMAHADAFVRKQHLRIAMR